MSSTVHTPSPSESASPYATAASAKDNASRLRENQRRSRARKKEYLTSLEARVQACQRAGVEANVEIQNAAKRVVRENVLLREILRNRGVGDDEIDRIIREGGEGGVNGESAVEGVMKVLGRRPCGGEPLLMEKLGGERFNDRRNSTGMLGARDAGDRATRGSETPPCLPATGSGTCASAKCSSQPPLSPPSLVLPLSAHHRPPPPPPPPAFTPQHYPSPSGTPTSAVSTYTLPVSAPQLNPYCTFSSLPPPSQSYTVTSPTYPPASPAAASYQQFYPAPPQNASPQSSNCCYPSQQQQQQQQQYQGSCSTSTTPCHLAQTFIQQLHPQDNGQLINEICPPEAMRSGNCHVDNGVLFSLLDKI